VARGQQAAGPEAALGAAPPPRFWCAPLDMSCRRQLAQRPWLFQRRRGVVLARRLLLPPRAQPQESVTTSANHRPRVAVRSRRRPGAAADVPAPWARAAGHMCGVRSPQLLSRCRHTGARGDYTIRSFSDEHGESNWDRQLRLTGEAKQQQQQQQQQQHGVDLRVDPADGNAYTREDFLEHYGSLDAWNAAEPVSSGRELRMDPTDSNWYTQAEFYAEYGSNAEWEAAARSGVDFGATAGSINSGHAGSGPGRAKGAAKTTTAAAPLATRLSGGDGWGAPHTRTPVAQQQQQQQQQPAEPPLQLSRAYHNTISTQVAQGLTAASQSTVARARAAGVPEQVLEAAMQGLPFPKGLAVAGAREAGDQPPPRWGSSSSSSSSSSSRWSTRAAAAAAPQSSTPAGAAPRGLDEAAHRLELEDLGATALRSRARQAGLSPVAQRQELVSRLVAHARALARDGTGVGDGAGDGARARGGGLGEVGWLDVARLTQAVDIEHYSNATLKQWCARNGLPQGGAKKVLVDRLQQFAKGAKSREAANITTSRNKKFDIYAMNQSANPATTFVTISSSMCYVDLGHGLNYDRCAPSCLPLTMRRDYAVGLLTRYVPVVAGIAGLINHSNC
jgi:hypothetical protein